MPNTDTIFAFPSSEAGAKSATSRRPVPTVPCPVPAVGRKEAAIDLDMGEASREQGFRLWGCR